YVLGSKHGALIVKSTFDGNTAANAGAVGGLFTELDIYDSLFSGNKAIGHDANNNEPDKCSAMNNGQNETGSGGNGGVLSITDTTMTGNTGGSWTNVTTGSVTYVGTAVGTNCKSITVVNSTLQDYP